MASSPDSWKKMKETRTRLEKCWKSDVDWSLYPATLKEGCEQVAKAMNVPPTAVLCGYIVIGSFLLSPSSVKIPGTDWKEPILVWLTVCMPTGSGKSTLFRHLFAILQAVREKCGMNDDSPSWVFDDASFEKMGALMNDNSGRLLGFYDEMAAFLSQINLYRGRGLSDSHELSQFLQLYNGHPWRRDTVSGEANFAMPRTCLTVGGFTQPGVARALIEMPSNSEKGLTHRFIWFFPNPQFGKFSNLGEVDRLFLENITNLLAKQWKKPEAIGKHFSPREFSIMRASPTFGEYYDEVQAILRSMAGMNEFLCGMLSKSCGQILRLATVLHMLFNIDNADEPLSDEISEAAVGAAVDFLKTACQQVAYIAGKGVLSEEVEKLNTDVQVYLDGEARSEEEESTAAFCLTLPGRRLYLTPLLSMKKFRKRGNKEGAIRAFYKLEEEGLGKVLMLGGSKGTSAQFEFEKACMPTSKEECVVLAQKLSKYNISLTQYEQVLSQREIRPMTGVKRTLLTTPKKHVKSPRSSDEQQSPHCVTPHKTPTK